MHLSSLPSPYGIGAMGAAAREFVDFLAASGQSYWQLLPICPTSYGDSPYQSFSTFAGNPYFIDLDDLAAEGLLDRAEYENLDWGDDPSRVDYGLLYEKRYPVLRRAAERLLAHPPKEYAAFCRENKSWLPDFALFMALKDANGGKPWLEWDKALRDRESAALVKARRDYAADVDFCQALQYLYFHQWGALKAYANGKGVGIIGDLPIYVALDGADVWANPKLFQLDEELRPTEVAGCPPDAFTEDGQLWGNPLFDWEYMERDGYAWWVERIRYLCNVYDMLRIDHFRGFESYYAIPFGAVNAKIGRWRKGPGMKLFRAVEAAVGKQPIIAEDLGFLTPSVRRMLRASGFPGMRILEFAFDSKGDRNSEYLPHNVPPHCVAYTGTHDNETILGWAANVRRGDLRYAKEYLRLTKREGYHWGMMRGLWSSVAELTVVQAQDLLGLGNEARMNTPATVGANWRWRALPGAFDAPLAERLRSYMELYGRLSEASKAAPTEKG